MYDVLNKQQIDQFIHEGFVRIDNAFSSETAAAARDILWKDLGCDPHDASTWIKPVIRLGWYSQPVFVEAANTPTLHAAFNQLVGKDRWVPRGNMGSFPVRFPSTQDPGDTGWHVDTSFPGAEPNNFLNWRANVKSKDRALLMLFLFSDIGEHDAPTRIRVGSHIDVAGILKPEGDAGLSFMELAQKLYPLPERKEALAMGKAGTVYLCHPFIVHAAQPHRGSQPRFLAQPPLQLKGELDPEGPEILLTPLEQAIRLAIC